MKRSRSIIALSLTVIISLSVVQQWLPSARADKPIFTVFGPTAKDGDSSGESYGSTDPRKLDGLNNCFPGPGYVITTDFTSYSYSEYWNPYSNRTNFPSDNATIYSVHLLTVLYCPPSRSFCMMLGIWNETTGFYDGVATSGWITGQGSPTRAYEYNVTTAISWNATILKNETYVSVWFITLDSGSPIYVDYIGLNYTWQWNDTWSPPGGSATTAMSILSITGLLGIFGFGSMIAAPAVGIWFYRQDGGSKIITTIGVICMFTVGFALFMGSIAG